MLACLLLARHTQAIRPPAMTAIAATNPQKSIRSLRCGDRHTTYSPAAVTTAIAAIAANGHQLRARPPIARV